MTAIPVADRLAIHELSAEYAFRCDTGKYDEIAQLFTEDGTWDETAIGAPLAQGHAAITQVFTAMGEHIDGLIHINSNHRLAAFDGARATGTSHVLAESVYHGTEVRIRGYYDDMYIKVAGAWRFQHRKLVTLLPTIGMESE